MKQLLLLIALLVLLVGFDSCTMHYEHGTPYRVGSGGGRSKRHWGSRRYDNSTHRFWSRRKYGPRTYKYRGHFREYQYH